MPSTRSSSRARTESERGFALISAIVLAILYFGLMELMMIDATRTLQEAQRFKAKIIATTLAESAAELAAQQLITSAGTVVTANTAQGTIRGVMKKTSAGFELEGEAVTSGILPMKASCIEEGTITGNTISIRWSRTSQ